MLWVATADTLRSGQSGQQNERTGCYQGIPMNHQFEKSELFLGLLNCYFRTRFEGALQVFSPVHGLFDLGIYARFLRFGRRLLDLQSSCGGSNSYRKHCGRCEKCAFVSVLLAGLSSDVNAHGRLFPVNPLEDTKLFDGWYQGRFEKPCACVGSLRELRVALRLGRAQGWNSSIHRYDQSRGRPPGAGALSHYLAVHTNRFIPSPIRERIEPLLEFDSMPLAELLESHP